MIKTMKERRAYISLILISAILCGGTFLLSLKGSRDNTEKICAIISIIVDTPVPPPADPANDPIQERSYKHYQEFLKLDQASGCSK